MVISNHSMANFSVSPSTIGTKFTPTADTDYTQDGRIISTKLQCITGMEEYKNKSFEELRFEDCNLYKCSAQKGTTNIFEDELQKIAFGNSTFGNANKLPQHTTVPIFTTQQVFGNNTTTCQPNFGTTNSSQSTIFNKSLPTTQSSCNTAPFGNVFGNNTDTTQSNFANTFGQSSSFGNTTYSPFGNNSLVGKWRGFGTITNSPQSSTFNKSLPTTQSSFNTVPFGNVFGNNTITTQSNVGDSLGQSNSFNTTTNSLFGNNTDTISKCFGATILKPPILKLEESNKSLFTNFENNTIETTRSNLFDATNLLTSPSGYKLNPISSNPMMQFTFNIYGESVNNNQPTNQTHQINIPTSSVQSDTECLLNLESLQVNISMNKPKLCADTDKSEVVLNSIDNIETCGIKSTRSDYYTIPPLNCLHVIKNKNGTCNIKGFIIGRFGYGHICFPNIIDVTNLDIDKDVHINLRNICIYPDDKPIIGEGLNRKAVVTMHQVYRCKEEVDADPETMMGEIIFTDICKLGKTTFVEYKPESGTLVFEVDHF